LYTLRDLIIVFDLSEFNYRQGLPAADLSDFEMKVITTRAEGFITARQIAEVENVNFNRVVKAAVRARKKLVPVLRETAISKGYNPNGQFAPRLGHSRENKSQNKCGDYYYPKRERKNTTLANAKVV
jgi:hypothetical protein